MKLRPVFFGLLFALVGVALLLLYLRHFEQEAAGGTKIDLLVAVAPIERGKPVTDEMLGTRQVPRAYVDDRAIRASDRAKVLNLRAASTVPVLQTLAWTDFIATTDEHRDLSSLVQPGSRAMPIRMQSDEILGLVRPGDFVDVIGIFGESREATVLLQKVLVLAAGLETTAERTTADKKAGSQRMNTLTLSVSLQESQLLALGMSMGKVAVVIRNVDDPRIVDNAPDISSLALFDVVKRQAVQNTRRKAPVKLEAQVKP
jgi:pilus assembly protein CpaB